MNNNLCEIVFILDRSGSMSSMGSEAISGFNSFLEEQKKLPGEAKLTLVLFDHEYTLLYDGQNIKDVSPLNETTYMPRGTTALLDGIGRAIDDVGKRLADTPEEQRPGKVLVAILTDGLENASKDYKKFRINEMISHQRDKYSWQFLFLAANQDAISEGTKIGVLNKNAATFTYDQHGIASSFAAINSASTQYRATGSISKLCDLIKK